MLVLCLFRLRAALIGTIVVPLSVLAAALVLWAFGSTMNAILLAGLVGALVLVIDDAIVSTEHITRRLEHERSAGTGNSPAQTILEATLEVRRPAVYATPDRRTGDPPALLPGAALEARSSRIWRWPSSSRCSHRWSWRSWSRRR